MKKNLLLSFFILFTTAAYSQNTDAVKYADVITGERLKQHLTIIAGEEMEGRETGTEGQRKAAAYIEEQFKKIGLAAPPTLNGYQQYYPLFQDSTDVTTCLVSFNNVTAINGEDYFVPIVNNASKKINATEFVFVGYGVSDVNYDDYKNIDVKGKVVVMFLGEPKADGKYLVSGTSKNSKYTYPGLPLKMKIAAEKGATAAIVINQGTAEISKYSLNANKKSRLIFPSNGDAELANYIVASHKVFKQHFYEWKPDSLIEIAKQNIVFSNNISSTIKMPFVFNYSKERTIIKASNVIGVIEGTDKKDEYVFLTAHYDHLGKQDGKIYYGADDDGSGTCAVINMAEAFAKAKAEGNGPRRTIVFMTVSGEEKGLWGSEYYSDHPIFSLDKTTVDLNIDMIGRIDTERKKDDTLNYIYVVGHNKVSTELPIINEGVNKKYTGLALDYKFDNPSDPERIYYRSDHYNFARKGVPVLFFYDGMLKADYHKPTDTVDKIIWDLYTKRTRMIFHTAWAMANRNEMLKRDLGTPVDE